MLLLILAAVWAAFLIPPILRRRAERRPADSILAFDEQLRVLRRAHPRAANHGDWALSDVGMPHHGIAPHGMAQHGMAQRHVALVAPPAAPVLQPTFGSLRSLPRHRSTARRRRRDIFMALLFAAGTTLVLGAVPALRMLWVVHGVVDVLLVSYVALLIRQRNLATERALKVRLLPTARRHEARLEAEGRWVDGEGGWLGAEPALLRRSAT